MDGIERWRKYNRLDPNIISLPLNNNNNNNNYYNSVRKAETDPKAKVSLLVNSKREKLSAKTRIAAGKRPKNDVIIPENFAEKELSALIETDKEDNVEHSQTEFKVEQESDLHYDLGEHDFEPEQIHHRDKQQQQHEQLDSSQEPKRDHDQAQDDPDKVEGDRDEVDDDPEVSHELIELVADDKKDEERLGLLQDIADEQLDGDLLTIRDSKKVPEANDDDEFVPKKKGRKRVKKSGEKKMDKSINNEDGKMPKKKAKKRKKKVKKKAEINDNDEDYSDEEYVPPDLNVGTSTMTSDELTLTPSTLNRNTLTSALTLADYVVAEVKESEDPERNLDLSDVTDEAELRMMRKVMEKRKELHSVLTDRKLYGCMLCGFKGMKELWVKHLKVIHEDEALIFCQRCEMPFKDERMLTSHMNRVHTGKGHDCSRCGKRFKFPYLLKAHLEKDKRTFTCAYCGKDYESYRGLKYHEATKHTKNRLFECISNGCGKRFYAHGDLLIHIRSHTGEKPFLCELCGNGFASKKRLKSHVKVIHEEKAAEKSGKKIPQPVTVCHVCNKQVMKKQITTHLKTHTKEDQVKCPTCSKVLASKHVLKRHQKVHENIKEFTCGHCGKAFAQKVNLQAHENIHKNFTPYRCSNCGKGFYQASNKKTHESKCEARSQINNEM